MAAAEVVSSWMIIDQRKLVSRPGNGKGHVGIIYIYICIYLCVCDKF